MANLPTADCALRPFVEDREAREHLRQINAQLAAVRIEARVRGAQDYRPRRGYALSRPGRHGPHRARRTRTIVVAALAVVATALVGGVAAHETERGAVHSVASNGHIEPEDPIG